MKMSGRVNDRWCSIFRQVPRNVVFVSLSGEVSIVGHPVCDNQRDSFLTTVGDPCRHSPLVVDVLLCSILDEVNAVDDEQVTVIAPCALHFVDGEFDGPRLFGSPLDLDPKVPIVADAVEVIRGADSVDPPAKSLVVGDCDILRVFLGGSSFRRVLLPALPVFSPGRSNVPPTLFMGKVDPLRQINGPSPFGVRSECEAVGMGRYNM